MWKEYICGKDCNSYLGSFFNSISEGISFHELIYDENGNPIDYKFLEINNAFTNITGLIRDDIIGKKVSDLESSLDKFWINIYKIISTLGIPSNFKIYNDQLDKHFKISVFSPVKNQFTVFFTDITDCKKANEITKKHQLLFDNAQDIILYSNSQGNIIDANMSALFKYGYSIDELTKLNVQNLRHPSTKNWFHKQMEEADKNGITFECEHVKKDGSSFPVEVSVKSTLIDENILRIHIVRDISERKMEEEKILYLANYDSLTDIPNRNHLMNHLNLTLKHANRRNFKFAVMLFDIDKFKAINDTYGHTVGDIVLKETAQAVENTIRQADFIARLGGDEFVIVQPYISNHESCSVLIKRIIENLETPLKIDKTELNIDISIGVSIYPDDATDIESLMDFADKAMYASKQIHGTSFEFYSNINDSQ
jgi:diguanylate cyclase (GGDEF)-like protein/PAS domain S-box-containing protein